MKIKSVHIQRKQIETHRRKKIKPEVILVLNNPATFSNII